jgi:hypothetical protein
MKNLIKKELTLCTNPQVIIFCLLSALVVIPQWPAMIAMIYVLSGLMTIFPRALADQDLQYTAMLPIRKGDVVKGKACLLSILELGSLLFSVPFALMKVLLFDPGLLASYQESGDKGQWTYTLMMQPSLGGYGYTLLAMGFFNAVLLPWYYRNPQKVNWPPLVTFFASLFLLGLGIGAESLTVAALNYDKTTLLYWLVEGGVLLGGLLLFFGLSILGEKKGEKSFAKVDL